MTVSDSELYTRQDWDERRAPQPAGLVANETAAVGTLDRATAFTRTHFAAPPSYNNLDPLHQNASSQKVQWCGTTRISRHGWATRERDAR